MNEYTNYLVSVYYSQANMLIRCALRIRSDMLLDSVRMFPDENKNYIHSLLPLHIQSCGPVVHVETIEESHHA